MLDLSTVGLNPEAYISQMLGHCCIGRCTPTLMSIHSAFDNSSSVSRSMGKHYSETNPPVANDHMSQSQQTPFALHDGDVTIHSVKPSLIEKYESPTDESTAFRNSLKSNG